MAEKESFGIWDALKHAGGQFFGGKKEQAPNVRRPAVSRSIPRGATSYSYSTPLNMEPMTQEMFEGVRDRKTIGLESQRRGYKELLDEVKQYRQDIEGSKDYPDLSNLLGASDAIAGTNYLKNYTPPKSRAAKKKELMQLEAGLNKLARGLTMSEIDLIKSQFQPRGGSESASLGFPKPSAIGGADELKVLKTKEAQSAQAQINLKSALQKYKDLVARHGVEVMGREADIMEAAYADLKIKKKEADKLGALTGPDITILMEQIKPATGFRGALRGTMAATGLGGGTQGIMGGIDQIASNLNNDFNTTMSSLNTTFPGSKNVQNWQRLYQTAAPSNIRPEQLKEAQYGSWAENLLGPKTQRPPQERRARGSAPAKKGRGAAKRRKRLTFEEWKKSKGM